MSCQVLERWLRLRCGAQEGLNASIDTTCYGNIEQAEALVIFVDPKGETVIGLRVFGQSEIDSGKYGVQTRTDHSDK